MKHLVDQLLGTRVELPRPSGSTVVVEGKRITDLRQVKVPDDPEEQARLRSEVRRAKAKARYERRKHDPDYQAMRRAYDERTREQRQAWKREYDQRTKERQRQQKTEWARRDYLANPEKYKAARRAHYEKNRAAILAGLQAKRDAAKGTTS